MASWPGRPWRPGLHVFCEKPLCYGLAEIDELAAAQARAGVVLQVGTMKRFDPSYERALELVADKSEHLRLVAVEVNDPDAWPFVVHQPVLAATDVPPDLMPRPRRGAPRRSKPHWDLRHHTSSRAVSPAPIARPWCMT